MKKLVLSFILALSSTSFLLASHLLGGELKLWTDTTGSTNNVMVELRLMRDANGINLPNTQTITVTENGMQSTIQLVLDPSTGNGNLITNPQLSIPVELFVYTGVYTPQTLSNIVTASFNTCCRPASVDNIFDSFSQAYHIYAELDLAQGFNSELPNIAPLAAYANVGVPFVFSNFTQDADGDSLYFALDTPLAYQNQYVPQYHLPFGLTNPIPPNFTINPTSGLVFGNPIYSGVFAYRIVIEEFRRDSSGVFQLLATHNKDLAVLTLNASNNNNAFVLASIPGSTTLPNGAKQVDFIGDQNNQVTLSFNSISTEDFEIEVYGGPFDFDAQNTSVVRDSTSATTCDYHLSWNPSAQYVSNQPYYFVVRTLHYGFPNDMLLAIAVNTSVGQPEITVSEVKLYPNPTSDFLQIEADTRWEKAEIINMNGVVVQLIDKEINRIRVSELPSGTYFIKLLQGDALSIHRFVKL